METIKPVETTYSLPSSGTLLRKTQEYTSATIVSPVDKMMIDEPYETEETQVSPLSENKPHLPSINSIQPFSPIPHNSTTTSDEYLRHRMSDMSMSAINNNNNNNNNNNHHQHHHPHPSHTSIPLGRSSSHHSSTDPSSEVGGGPYDPIKSSLSPLEANNSSNHYYDGNGLPSFSRRGSLANPNASSPLDYRRPSITELNSLPLPNTAPLPTLSRRDSVVTTNSDYEDPLSRSPSPSPFKQSAYSHHPLQRASPPRELDLHPHHPLHHPHHLSNSHDTFQRRHSIATVEPSYPSSSSRLLSKHHRPFQFPDTIHESTTTATSDNSNNDKHDHGIYSAPSSPPGINNTNNNNSSSTSHHSYHPLHPTSTSSSSSSRYTRNYNMRQASSSSINESTYQQHHSHHPLSTATSSNNSSSNQHQRSHHPYPHPYANGYSRRRSIMNDEDIPQLARRASMPVVNVGRPSTNHPHYSHQPISSSHPGGEPFDSHPHSSSSSSYHDLLLDHPHSHHHDTLRKEKSPTTPTTSLSSSTINANNANNASSNRKSETPYSRSPELRISHKLAERKRRKEMKELFDELRDSLPVEKNLKTSKWEILSKAVEYIGTLKRRDYEKENEVNNLRLEIARLKHERSGSLTY